MTDKPDDPLWGLTEADKLVMGWLLRTPPEPQKAAPKLASARAKAQRKRRRRERQVAAVVKSAQPACHAEPQSRY